jgi:drug/metabolite transporter (DMT)-like permease
VPSASTSNRRLGFAACAGASTLWGCGFFFGKIALREMNVGAMVFYRFFFAALVLLPLLLRRRHQATTPRFTAADWRTLLIGSFLGIPLQFLLQFRGLSLTTVSHAALMVGTMPVILAVGATLFAHERLHGWGWLAIAASTAGAALITLGHSATASANGPTLRGDLLVVVSLVIALGWILTNKDLIERHSPTVVSAYGITVGTLMLCVIVPVLYGLPPVRGVSLEAWLALAASGVLCTSATTLLWNYGMTQVPASEAGVLLNIEPLIGSVLGILLLHETLGPLAYLGGALIVASAVLLTTSRPATVKEMALEV